MSGLNQASQGFKGTSEQLQQVRSQLTSQVTQLTQQVGYLKQKQEEQDMKLGQQMRSYDNLNNSFSQR